MKVAIVGSRDYPLPRLVREFVAGLPDGSTVVSGGARGVDGIAEEAARVRGLPVVVIPALWEEHGRRAGVLRNQDIVDLADVVYAFWDGRSRGTADTIRRARLSHKLGRIFTTRETAFDLALHRRVRATRRIRRTPCEMTDDLLDRIAHDAVQRAPGHGREAEDPDSVAALRYVLRTLEAMRTTKGGA